MEESGKTEEETGEPEIIYWKLKRLVLEEFPEIVLDAVVEREPGDTHRNLRVFLIGGSFLDVWISEDKYSYHWQNDNKVVRFDNAPHHEEIETHPHHKHLGDEIEESPLSGKPEEDIGIVLSYIKERKLDLD